MFITRRHGYYIIQIGWQVLLRGVILTLNDDRQVGGRGRDIGCRAGLQRVNTQEQIESQQGEREQRLVLGKALCYLFGLHH